MSVLQSPVLMLLILASSAGANSFANYRPASEPDRGKALQRDASLINDGSFEDGTCREGASAWTCESSHDCDWIVDLVPLGLSNYDGSHAGWLGGSCGGQIVESTSLCQDLFIDGSTLSWYSMSSNYFVGPIPFTVSMDGEVIQEIPPDDWHPGGGEYVQQFADVSAYMGAVHRLCFDYERNGDDSPPSCFVDFVELSLPTGVPENDAGLPSLSLVKALY